MNSVCEFVIAEVKDVLTVPSEALKGADGISRWISSGTASPSA